MNKIKSDATFQQLFIYEYIEFCLISSPYKLARVVPIHKKGPTIDYTN